MCTCMHACIPAGSSETGNIGVPCGWLSIFLHPSCHTVVDQHDQASMSQSKYRMTSLYITQIQNMKKLRMKEWWHQIIIYWYELYTSRGESSSLVPIQCKNQMYLNNSKRKYYIVTDLMNSWELFLDKTGKHTNWQTDALDTCMTSKAPSSVHRPFSGLYTCVPLMMTVWAGKLTPQARVAVETRT